MSANDGGPAFPTVPANFGYAGAMTLLKMGPRRKAWEKLKRSNDRLRRQIRQFNTDLASIKENNPNCRNLPINPIPLPQPLPPMPRWEE